MWAGSLIKLVYFSRHEDQSTNDERMKSVKDRLGIPNGSSRRSYPILGGRLHFVKFETNKINECLEFINSKQLHRSGIIVLFNQSLLCHVGLLRTSSTGLHWMSYYSIFVVCYVLFQLLSELDEFTFMDFFLCLQFGNHITLMLWLIPMPSLR